MWFLNRLVNPLVRALLRSPLHPLLSGRLMLLRVTGRRTGRTFEFPVGYSGDDRGLVVRVAAPHRKQWWRNITGATPVTVVLRGTVRRGVAELDAGDAQTQVRIALSGRLPSVHGPSA